MPNKLFSAASFLVAALGPLTATAVPAVGEGTVVREMISGDEDTSGAFSGDFTALTDKVMLALFVKDDGSGVCTGYFDTMVLADPADGTYTSPIINGDFASGASDWLLYSATAGTSGIDSTSGNYDTSTSDTNSYLVDAGTTFNALYQPVSVTPGTAYSLSGWIKYPAASACIVQVQVIPLGIYDISYSGQVAMDDAASPITVTTTEGTPTISGAAGPNQMVYITVDGTLDDAGSLGFSVMSGSDGLWTYTLSNPLPDDGTTTTIEIYSSMHVDDLETPSDSETSTYAVLYEVSTTTTTTTTTEDSTTTTEDATTTTEDETTTTEDATTTTEDETTTTEDATTTEDTATTTDDATPTTEDTATTTNDTTTTEDATTTTDDTATTTDDTATTTDEAATTTDVTSSDDTSTSDASATDSTTEASESATDSTTDGPSTTETDMSATSTSDDSATTTDSTSTETSESSSEASSAADSSTAESSMDISSASDSAMSSDATSAPDSSMTTEDTSVVSSDASADSGSTDAMSSPMATDASTTGGDMSASATDDMNSSATDDMNSSATDDMNSSATNDMNSSATDDAATSATDGSASSATDDASSSTTNDVTASSTTDDAAASSATDDMTSSAATSASASTTDAMESSVSSDASTPSNATTDSDASASMTPSDTANDSTTANVSNTSGAESSSPPSSSSSSDLDVNPTDAPDDMESFTTEDGQKWEREGCFGSSVDGFVWTAFDAELEPRKCAKICREAGAPGMMKRFFGLHDTNCYCAVEMSPTAEEAGDGECSTPCPGDDTYTCGGNKESTMRRHRLAKRQVPDNVFIDIWALAVEDTSSSSMSSTDTVTAPTSSMSSAVSSSMSSSVTGAGSSTSADSSDMGSSSRSMTAGMSSSASTTLPCETCVLPSSSAGPAQGGDTYIYNEYNDIDITIIGVEIITYMDHDESCDCMTPTEISTKPIHNVPQKDYACYVCAMKEQGIEMKANEPVTVELSTCTNEAAEVSHASPVIKACHKCHAVPITVDIPMPTTGPMDMQSDASDMDMQIDASHMGMQNDAAVMDSYDAATSDSDAEEPLYPIAGGSDSDSMPIGMGSNGTDMFMPVSDAVAFGPAGAVGIAISAIVASILAL